MARWPTPISDEMQAVCGSLAAAAEGTALSRVGLLDLAARLQSLAARVAPLERFHAELVAEAAEEELRQSHSGPDTPAYVGRSGPRR